MIAPTWWPGALARRFALVAAGLAALTVLLGAASSWWLVERQQQQALQQLAAKERGFRAATVGGELSALAGRMAEIASSTILATGLVDSAGRETYLTPFLQGVRQVNGVPVQVLFTDFEGETISSNGSGEFAAEQRAWLREKLAAGRPAAAVFASPGRPAELVAIEPMTYARTRSPEGAVFYKIALADLHVGEGMRLEWGSRDAAASADVAALAVPPVFAPLGLRLRTEQVAETLGVAPPYALILGLALLLFAAIALAGARLAQMLTRDLSALEAFSGRLVGSGLTAERAPDGGSAEVAGLARSINAMLDRLHEQQGALIAEREKLTALTDALQLADQRKNDFLAMLGHELRNPLAPISTGAELLRRLAGSDPRMLRLAESIARQAQHMTKIVDDLLDVSRVTRGRITLEREPLDLVDVVTTAVEQTRPLYERCRQRLEVALPPERVVVLGDRARLVQVVANLLDNAAKHSPDGSHVTLQVERRGERAAVVVCDNGHGIPPELLPQLFELFSQGPQSSDRAKGGLGLGLALVRHLVELHGGAVEAHSDGANRGACFTVTLPLERAEPRPPRPTPAIAALGAPGARATSRRVLLVDDNLDAAESLATLLRLEGHEVSVAGEAGAALALAAQHPFDVCVLDIGLPGLDGHALAQRLRTVPGTAAARMFALTGYGQAADRDRSAAAGLDGHFVKPVDPALVAAAIAQSRGAAEPRASAAMPLADGP